jgi:branched-subunit amino acid transport protein
MSKQEIFITIFLMGVVTYLPRLLPMLLLSNKELPRWFGVWLKYVPTAIFGSLIFSEIFVQGDQLFFSFSSPQLLASAIAFFVAIRSGSIPFTVGAGAVSFWMIQKFLSF